MSNEDLERIQPDRVFDGGDLDCGSGLVLLIREQMSEIPEGSVLEMRSREPTVRDDLPPWCRMVGHDYLGRLPAEGTTVRYFVRKGKATAAAEEKALAEDKKKAEEYEWRLRVRSTGHLESTAYCRNFSFKVGQPASFEEKDTHPSAVELLLGALGAALSTGFATEISRAGLEVDDIELTVRGRLGNPLASLGLGEGDPGLREVDVKCFASTMADEAAVREAWERTVARSPVAATISRATVMTTKIVVL
ncbi:MAG: osmotically inducible protein OsmC [Candidatus Eisenbacteria bacterium]|nr:osmotically inducible protein OsmC [Candidatus Latescibacterota bacterium]MBD3302533.1 osmotically inducible protein OsmC [Candidatus Eisenbacteria bacterium]